MLVITPGWKRGVAWAACGLVAVVIVLTGWCIHKALETSADDEQVKEERVVSPEEVEGSDYVARPAPAKGSDDASRAGDKVVKSPVVEETGPVEKAAASREGEGGVYNVGAWFHTGSGDPEKVRQQQKEIRELFARGDYELEITERALGEKDYLYKFILSDGEEFRVGSPKPLADPGAALTQQLELADLVAQGKGELVEVKELPGGRLAYIYEFVLADGRVVKYSSATPLKLAE